MDAPTQARLEKLDALEAYKAQAIRISPAEQDALAHAVIEAREAAARLEKGNVSRRERIELERAVRKGAQARDTLIKSVIQLVVTIATAEAGRRFGRRTASLIDEIVASGNAGAAASIDSWDPGRGRPWHQWAADCIRREVQAACNEHVSIISVPSSWARVGRLAAEGRAKLIEKLGREPTLDELRQDILDYCLTQRGGDTPENREHLRRQGVLGAIEHLEEVISRTNLHDSVDRELGGDDDSFTHLSHLTDNSHEEAFRQAELAELRETIMAILDTFDEREKTILMYRYGFVDGERWPYPRIGKMFNITGERVRQIEAKLLEKLSSPKSQYVHMLRPHLEEAA